ncbi:hypothetical protein T4D_17196 [Trichinella pseudospiralis]|uniref:Uncharacterized protein n=1 Tax=Trichinella pseudospiralis TaxID=6337 RepID=A0A0V1F492_TRIPS|nr:hypothetical protein T4D_17196 [Trichinella pseudospiralis]
MKGAIKFKPITGHGEQTSRFKPLLSFRLLSNKRSPTVMEFSENECLHGENQINQLFTFKLFIAACLRIKLPKNWIY